MGFQGINIKLKDNPPIRSLDGFYGFNVSLNLTGIKITDYRGMGLPNVKVIAENPISDSPYVGLTDKNGTVYMQLDETSNISLIKDMIKKEVPYNGEISPTYIIDSPFIG